MKELTKTLLYEWKNRKLPEVKKRVINLKEYFSAKIPKIVVLSGFRRVGKTYLLLYYIQELLQQKSRSEVVYLNFEDERIPLKDEFLTSLLPIIKETFGEGVKFIFLDEIQNFPSWGKWLRRIYDQEEIYLFVSGSSSKMSSKEIPTELRGRFMEVRVFPLSFGEFLQFKNISFEIKTLSYLSNEKAKLLRLLEEFLQLGGLPEIVLSEDRKREIAQSYYQTVVRRDIIERHKIKNEETLKALLILLLNSTSYSITKLNDTLKSLNYAVGKATLQKYLAYIENSYFMFSVPIFSYKVKDKLLYPRKIYCIDNIFLTTLATKPVGRGQLFENMVFIQLLKKFSEGVHYWKNPQQEEVDFVIVDNLKIKQLIQVCCGFTEEKTKEREVRSLLKASQELRCRDLLVITDDYESVEEASWFGIKGKIKFVPLWKWLLEN